GPWAACPWGSVRGDLSVGGLSTSTLSTPALAVHRFAVPTLRPAAGRHAGRMSSARTSLGLPHRRRPPTRRRLVAAEAIAMTVVVVAVTLHSPTPVAPAQAQHSPGRGLPSTVRSPSFDWPLTPRPRVVRPFDPPTSPYGPGHRGVDLAAAPGQPVLAAAEGRIVHAGT